MELAEARKKARYTQEQVAGLLGISRPTYAKMESCPGIVTIDEARKLAEIFDVDVAEIFSPITIVKPIVTNSHISGN